MSARFQNFSRGPRQSQQTIFKGVVKFCGIFVVLVANAFEPIPASAQDSPDYFRQNCMNCHTIGGGRLNGPDLKDVGKRQSEEWLVTFIQNPRAVIQGGDARAVKLMEEFNNVIMPTPPNMSRYRAEQLVKLIAEESRKEKSQFQGIKISNKPFTERDRIAGYEIFTGLRKLQNGGTACNSCHTMHDLSQLGGGNLGPDLTRVYERQKGRKALSAWLMAPATETMQPIFKDHPLEAEEIHQLTAYFAASAKSTEADSSMARITFLLMGLSLATALIFLMDRIWKTRFQGVRRPLVEANAIQSQFDLQKSAGHLPATASAESGNINGERGQE